LVSSTVEAETRPKFWREERRSSSTGDVPSSSAPKLSVEFASSSDGDEDDDDDDYYYYYDQVPIL
jgi:hypothetical protein